MWRICLPACIIICIGTSVFGQPVLTSSNAGPRIGDEIYYYYTTGGNPGNPGAGQTWDFSGVKATGTYTGSIIPCSTAGNCDTFPGTTIVNRALQFAYFLNAGSDTLQNTGNSFANSYPEIYSDPQALLRFPFTYGDSNVDSFRSTQRTPNALLTRTGSDSTTADGWGTIIIKWGSVSGVLRVKKVLTTEDRIDTGGTPIIYHAKTITYAWYLPGYHEYLLYTSTTTTDNPARAPVSSEGRYTGLANSSGIEIAAVPSLINIVGNPARQTLHLSFSVAPAGGLEYFITDMPGRVLLRRHELFSGGITQLSVPIEHLQPGVYFITCRSRELSGTQRFLVE